jgi:peptide/nickel transport system ATP-binding protein
MTAPLLDVHDLTVRYRRSRRVPVTPAVNGVDLAIGRGETVGLVGESGSGKTSLGFALLGLAPVVHGTVRFDGEDVTAAPGAVRRRLSRRMQVIFQDPFGSMNPTRTVGDTIGEGLRYGAGVAAGPAKQRVDEVLAEVGLPASAAERYPAHFSGGQRQRIAIARAIAVDPDFIVCDEAVSALDLSVQAQVLNLLAWLKAAHGLSYLFISHDLSVVRYLSDRIVVMYAGRVVEQGPAELVSTEPVHPYTRALVAAAPVPDPAAQARNRAARQALAVRQRGAPAVGCAFAGRCPLATDVCRTERPPLRTRDDGHQVACHHQDG